MTQYDVAGILKTYAEQATKVKTKEQLKKIIRNVREEFDLRQLEIEE